MCIYCKVYCSFQKITNFSTETSISDELASIINKSCSHETMVVREFPYIAKYHGCSANYKDPQAITDAIEGTSPIKLDDSLLDAHVDISLFGRNSSGAQSIMLIETKNYVSNFYKLAYCCGSVGISTSGWNHARAFNTHILKTCQAKYLTDYQDGKLWSDISRLIEVHRQFDKCSLKPELYQAMYIPSSYREIFCKNIPQIYQAYLSAANGSIYANLVLTSGRYGYYHAWKVYKAYFECIELRDVCSVIKYDATKTIKPFSSNSNKNYDLYLIKITPSPQCPKCSHTMSFRESKKNKKFWACDSRHCTETVDIP